MTLRIGIIGATGHIGYVVDGIGDMPNARICAIAPGGPEESLDSVRSRTRARTDVAEFADFRELLDRAKPDIVAVSPRFHRHAAVLCEALRRGLPAYSEKPLALTLESLDAVRAAQRLTEAPIGMMLAFRYAPAFVAAQALVAAGEIGKPSVGYAQKSYKRGNRPDFYRERRTFGGIIPWVGIHAIDWLRWVGGWELTAVQACHVKMFRPDYPEMEDAATCLFETDNGGSAVMSFDFLRPAGAGTHGDDRLRLAGETGVIEVRGEDSLEWIDSRGVRQVVVDKAGLGPFADFALSVSDPEHPCRISTEDALRITEIVLKARDAADTHERVLL